MLSTYKCVNSIIMAARELPNTSSAYCAGYDANDIQTSTVVSKVLASVNENGNRITLMTRFGKIGCVNYAHFPKSGQILCCT